MSDNIQTYRTLEDGYLLRIPIEDKIIETVHQFAVEHGIPSATVSAIGAVKDVELGYYRLSDKTYLRKHFPNITELVSFSGNLSWIDGSPFLHAHATLGDDSFNVVGGHFFEGVVAITVEMHIKVFSERLNRKFDDVTGLNLLDI